MYANITEKTFFALSGNFVFFYFAATLENSSTTGNIRSVIYTLFTHLQSERVSRESAFCPVSLRDDDDEILFVLSTLSTERSGSLTAIHRIGGVSPAVVPSVSSSSGEERERETGRVTQKRETEWESQLVDDEGVEGARA